MNRQTSVSLLLGVLCAGGYIAWAFHMFLPPFLGSPWEVLRYVLTWDALLAFAVVFSLLRAFCAGSPCDDTSAQALVALMTHILLAFTFSDAWLGLVPSLATLFLLGRLVSFSPLRVFGFVVTLAPTVVTLVVVLYAALLQGV